MRYYFTEPSFASECARGLYLLPSRERLVSIPETILSYQNILAIAPSSSSTLAGALAPQKDCKDSKNNPSYYYRTTNNKTMANTFNAIWVHIVFHTKDNLPYLSWKDRNEVCAFIKRNSNNKGIMVDTVNGVKNHLHVLLRINTTQTVAESVNCIKGASSKWLNKNYKWTHHFQWQVGYAVFSVSPRDLPMIRNYIYYQEKHHKDNSLINWLERSDFPQP